MRHPLHQKRPLGEKGVHRLFFYTHFTSSAPLMQTEEVQSGWESFRRQ